jgi:hypothetical protein
MKEGGFAYSNYYCYIFNGLSNITFEINGVKFNMSPKSYLLDIGGGCVFSIVPMALGISDVDHTFLLGDAFLRHFYQVYDYDGQQVKLAVDVHS